jgi:hypothetical protein
MTTAKIRKTVAAISDEVGPDVAARVEDILALGEADFWEDYGDVVFLVDRATHEPMLAVWSDEFVEFDDRHEDYLLDGIRR